MDKKQKKTEEISDEELKNVSGGRCGSNEPKNQCPDCKKKLHIHDGGDGRTPGDETYAYCDCGYDSRYR